MKTIALVLIAVLHTTAPAVEEKPHDEKIVVIINGEEREVSQRFIEQCKEADERINASFTE